MCLSCYNIILIIYTVHKTIMFFQVLGEPNKKAVYTANEPVRTKQNSLVFKIIIMLKYLCNFLLPSLLFLLVEIQWIFTDAMEEDCTFNTFAGVVGIRYFFR